MNFEIFYKKAMNSSFAGLSINGRYMQRLDKNSLYFLLGSEKILDLFYFDNGLERQVKNNKILISLARKNVNVFFKLSNEGEILLNTAYRLNGEFCFSFYKDDQNPFKELDKKVDVECAKQGLVIDIGMLYCVSLPVC